MSTLLRWIGKPEPLFHRGDPSDVGLSRVQLDDLIEYHIDLPNPRFLTKNSFYAASLTDSKSTSEKIYKALQKASIIPASSDENSGLPVNTAAIGRNFSHQLSFVSEYTRRKLVGMLFFWEEQCTRWRLLDEEEARILDAMGQEGVDGQELDLALQAVRQKKRLLPSQVQP